MTRISLKAFAVFAFMAVLAPVVTRASQHSLSEDAALNLLLRTLQHDHVYDKRISLDCVTFDTEEKTGSYFQVALRENHTAQCGGDPDVSPVVDRYRVYRASKKIEWLDRVEDKWQAYNPARIR